MRTRFLRRWWRKERIRMQKLRSLFDFEDENYPNFSEQLFKHRRNLLVISTIIISRYYWDIQIKDLPYIELPNNQATLDSLLFWILVYMAIMFLITASSEMRIHYKHDFGKNPIKLLFLCLIVLPIKLVKATLTIYSTKSVTYVRVFMDIGFPALLALAAIVPSLIQIT